VDAIGKEMAITEGIPDKRQDIKEQLDLMLSQIAK
jgi:hypothetical protein